MSRRHHVLLCCEHYPPSVGGVQEVMRQIAERLVVSGVDVTVATSTHRERDKVAMVCGVRVVSFPIAGNLVKGMTGPIEDYQAFIQQGGFDALLIKAAQQWTFDAAIEVIPKIECRKLFIPCGFSGLSLPAFEDYFRRMPGWLRCFDGLIFYASNYQDIDFARRHGIENLHLIPNGVDEREFSDPGDHNIRQRLGVEGDHDVLLSVGSLIAAKGHWELVRAFGRARLSRPATLIINANSPGRGLACLKRHIKHALSGRWPLSWLARWYGRDPARKRVMIVDLKRADLVDLYKSADLFVLASHVEYSPLVLFEAAAAGTTFLATSAGNSDEIAHWTHGGVVMPRRGGAAEVSAADLAYGIESLLADPERLSAIGKTSRSAIWSGGFIWEKIVPQYLHWMLESRSSSPETAGSNQ